LSDGLRRMILKNILILTVIEALVPTAMSNVSASAASEIALFSSDSDALSISGNGDNAKMELKASNENGRPIKVAGFQLTADNVLSIDVGDKVSVKDKVEFTKAITTDSRNNQKAIGITNNGVIDFTGYPRGVYTLDVVVDDDRAYEAINVIGEQSQEVINEQIIRVNTDTKIEFEFPIEEEGDKCSNDVGSGGLGFPQEEITECEVEEWDKCQKQPGGWRATDRCDIVHEIFHDDDCLGYASQEECDEAYNPKDPLQPEPIVGTCNDGATPINGYCPRPDPNGNYCHALGCPGSPPNIESTEPIYYEEPEPEPIKCNEGEELVDGQCQLIPENLEEPIIYDELVTDQGKEANDEGEESNEEEEEEESNRDEEVEDQDVEEEEEPEEEDQDESEEESTDGEGSDDSGEVSE
jgi:hypothetical protein